MTKKKKIEFLMDTDWMFEKPIDREHKEYKLLSYFQKMGERLDNMELYPGFIELSLHLANAQTLIKDKKMLYTNKRFKTPDDELLVKDLKLKELPKMSDDEYLEFVKILGYSLPRLTEYFNVAKSVWELVFDSVHLVVKKNKKNIPLIKDGFFYFKDKKNKKIYLWEYNEKYMTKDSNEKKIITKLIYCDEINKLTVPKIIIENTSREDKSKLPVIEMTSRGDFPIEETLLPLFKRKILSYLYQKRLVKENEENQD